MRTRLEHVACGACGGPVLQMRFRCDACDTEVTIEHRDLLNGITQPPPDGWVVVQRREGGRWLEPPEFCSWACAAAYTDARALAGGVPVIGDEAA